MPGSLGPINRSARASQPWAAVKFAKLALYTIPSQAAHRTAEAVSPRRANWP
jgi:hypothetical protein